MFRLFQIRVSSEAKVNMHDSFFFLNGDLDFGQKIVCI